MVDIIPILRTEINTNQPTKSGLKMTSDVCERNDSSHSEIVEFKMEIQNFYRLAHLMSILFPSSISIKQSTEKTSRRAMRYIMATEYNIYTNIYYTGTKKKHRIPTQTHLFHTTPLAHPIPIPNLGSAGNLLLISNPTPPLPAVPITGLPAPTTLLLPLLRPFPPCITSTATATSPVDTVSKLARQLSAWLRIRPLRRLPGRLTGRLPPPPPLLGLVLLLQPPPYHAATRSSRGSNNLPVPLPAATASGAPTLAARASTAIADELRHTHSGLGVPSLALPESLVRDEPRLRRRV